ncbi:MAG: MBL fold metallo-hydrolase [Sphingomonadales bacterium]
MADLSYPFDHRPAAGELLEVAPGVHWLRMPLPFALNHINLWLLEDGDGWVIIDTGLRSDKIRQHWKRIISEHMGERPVSRIIITHYHPDHIGLAGWLAERFDAPLWMSRTDYLYCQTLLLSQPDGPPEQAVDFYRRAGFGEKALDAFRSSGYSAFADGVGPLPAWFHALQDGDVIEIGGRNWHISTKRGHSPEHICLYCPELGLLISGDQILPRISTNISVFPLEPEANPLKEWLASLRGMFELPGDVLVLPSHNEPFYGLHERLNELLEHHDQRLSAVRQACGEGPKTVKDLYSVLFGRRIMGFEHMFAAGESLAHLNHLVDQGAIEKQYGTDGIDRYVTAGADL